MSNPVLKLFSPQNWTALLTGVTGARLTLSSKSTYTVKDSEGVELEITGKNLQATNVFGLHVLSGGTITGYHIIKNGKTIAVGDDYALPGHDFFNAVFTYLLSGKKTALFNLFLNAGESVVGSWKSIESGLSSFLLHSSIKEIRLTSGKAGVSTSVFAKDEATLDKIVGGFEITGTDAQVTAKLGALEKDVRHVNSVDIERGKAKFSTSIFARDERVLNKIVGGFEITGTGGQVTAKLGALEKDVRHVNSVDIERGKAKFSTSTFARDEGVLNKIVGGFEVYGAASSLEKTLSSLASDAKNIRSVGVTQGRISVGEEAFAADKAILDKVIGGFSIRDTAAHLNGKLAVLEADDKHIDQIAVAKGELAVSPATFTKDKTILDKVAGGFQVDATLGAIEGDAKALEWGAQHDHVESIRLLGKGTPIFHLTAAQAKNEQALLKAVQGDHIAEVRTSKGVVTSAFGDGLHIDDVKGRDAISAAGASEHFIFGADFGQASVSGFSNHLTGKTHDTIDAPKSEFANFAALLHDAHQSGHAVVIDFERGDKLTLENVTMAELDRAKFDFAFI